MEAMNLTKLDLAPTPLGGKARQLVDRLELRLVNLILEAGETVDKHSAPVEVVFLVLEGYGTISAGENRVLVEKGQFLCCPPGIMRSVAAGPEGLSLLVVRAPNQ
ncbi:MAG: cupin domain-containing protein [Syntrophomonadaceae bacterium]